MALSPAWDKGHFASTPCRDSVSPPLLFIPSPYEPNPSIRHTHMCLLHDKSGHPVLLTPLYTAKDTKGGGLVFCCPVVRPSTSLPALGEAHDKLAKRKDLFFCCKDDPQSTI